MGIVEAKSAAARSQTQKNDLNGYTWLMTRHAVIQQKSTAADRRRGLTRTATDARRPEVNLTEMFPKNNTHKPAIYYLENT